MRSPAIGNKIVDFFTLAHKISFYPLIVAIVLWMATTLFSHSEPFRFSDSKAYWFEANALVHDGEFREPFDTGTVPTTWRPPLTGFVTSLVLRTCDDPNVVVRLQQLMFFITAICLFACMRKLNVRAGIAMLFALFYLWLPSINDVARSIMSETWFMLFVVFSIFCALCLKDSRSRSSLMLFALMCGVSAGLALLTRTVFVALIPTILILVFQLIQTKKKSIAIWLFFFAFLATLAPWTLRNYQVHHQFVFINTADGYNVYLGNVHDTATMPAKHPDRQRIEILRKRYGEIKTQKILKSRAWRYILSHKAQSLKRWGVNSIKLWLSTTSRPRPLLFRLIVVFSKFTLLALALIGFFVFRKQAEAWAFICTPVFLTIVHAMTFATWRFWIPAAPACVFLAAMIVNKWLDSCIEFSMALGRGARG
ncbi:MAG: glycosyltransferase family 39 protein [Myxococcales bacterium]|nr:MAG: glycosyltransferase family 39 protein [Myxococcales bacterium]